MLPRPKNTDPFIPIKRAITATDGCNREHSVHNIYNYYRFMFVNRNNYMYTFSYSVLTDLIYINICKLNDRYKQKNWNKHLSFIV